MHEAVPVTRRSGWCSYSPPEFLAVKARIHARLATAHLPFDFSPKSLRAGCLAIFLNGSLSVLALRRTAKVVRFKVSAIVSALLALKTSSRSSLSRSGVQGRRGVPVISPSPLTPTPAAQVQHLNCIHFAERHDHDAHPIASRIVTGVQCESRP